MTDLTLLAGQWQQTLGNFGEVADNLNGNASWQSAIASVTFGRPAVPEPASLALLSLGTIALLSRRRR